ncbi:MAG: hypothetical protein ABI741_12975 [Ferruginibacter sp.]
MKKAVKIIIGILALALAGGWIYWQKHKKGIVKDKIENAVSKGTDSLYFIHYDSSSIDVVNGNASFYNIDLQSDSLQKQLLQFDTASSATVYNIHIDEVSVRGANIPALASNQAVDASIIRIIHPVIYIISSGKKEKKSLNSNDSLAIYEKILGKYKSIHSGEIIVENGNVFFSDKTGEPHTALKDVSIQLKNFRVDSTKDYQNIISYFMKGLVAKVKEVYINNEGVHTIFTDVEYNAPGKFIKLKNFQQKNKEQQIVFDINNTAINNINTDSFILNQQLKAEELISDGGMLTFYRKQNKNATSGNDEIEIDNNYFDEALLNKVIVGNTKILIYDKAKPASPPFTLTNVKFIATDIQKLYSGTSIRNLVSRSNWALSADGFSFMSEDKRYKMSVGNFDVNNVNSSMRISSFSVVPQVTEEAFSKSLQYQEDLYNINFKGIEVKGIDTRLLITQKRLEAETATLQPEIKAYNDRTVAPNPASKVGKYPHQLLKKIKLPLNIKKLIIKNGYVAYKEKGAISEQTGIVFFKNINGTISNVTNIKEVISKNNMLVLNARALFMGVSDLQTTWKLPLDTDNGDFNVSGVGGAFNVEALNSITEPLGMVSMRKGRVNKLSFDLTGNDMMAKGTSTLLYEDLKIDLLKKDSTDTKKKGLMSLVANILVKDKNPQNGEVRKNEVNEERVITKSFFYLVWRSIFSAAKKTVTGKSTD